MEDPKTVVYTQDIVHLEYLRDEKIEQTLISLHNIIKDLDTRVIEYLRRNHKEGFQRDIDPRLDKLSVIMGHLQVAESELRDVDNRLGIIIKHLNDLVV